MVRNSNPVYLDPTTGAVHGDPAPADGTADGTDNLIPNTLLDGVPLATVAPDTATTDTADPAASSDATAQGTLPADSATTGAATAGTGTPSVASDPDQLAAPRTR